MLLRRILPVALAAVVVVGCEPSVPKENAPSDTSPLSVDYAVFDPSTSQIPLPNDLGLQPSAIASQVGAQKELLTLFASQGGYPNDQEVPITIDFQRYTLTSNQTSASAPPAPLDLASLNAGNFLFIEKKGDGTIAPVPASSLDLSYANSASGDRGTLTIHNKPNATTHSRRWNAGSTYILLLRGGPNGVKFTGGGQVTAMATMYFLTQGLASPGTGLVTEKPGASLALPANQYLLPPAPGAASAREGRAATGNLLETLRVLYLGGGVFGLADKSWGANSVYEIAEVQTFTVAPTTANQPQVVMDASSGTVPLPSDLLLDPATGGKTVVNNPAFGPLASGIATLDGFSTTAMLLSQTSSPIVVQTVTKDTVFLYDLSNPAAPTRVKEILEGGASAGFVAEPLALGKTATGTACTTAAGCFSTAIGLQPGVIASASPLLTLPPLKEGTEYAVLVTDGVLAAPTAAGGSPAPLKRSTLASILLFENPLYDTATGKATLSGQDPAQSAGLEKMRQGVALAAGALQAEKGIAKSRVVVGYTFRTQSITGTSLKLAAAPYQNAAAFVPGAPTALCGSGTAPSCATASATIPVALPAVQEVLSVPIPTLNPIDVTTGALNPDTTKWTPTQLNALVIVPQAAAVPTACPGASSFLKCAPLVVFGHGLQGNKTQVLAIANTLASAGFVVAALDAPLHGDRAYCTSDAECVGGTPKCNFFGPAGLQGDSVQIGTCGGGSTPVAAVSGRFWLSANLFRTRDAIREDVLDKSALILALAPPTATQNPTAIEIASKGIGIDGRSVYWAGISLGGMYGTISTAVNPRISRAVLNVPGATIVDIGSTSPSFIPLLTQLLAGLTPPIAVGSPEYLQFLQVAKWILDPGDPINYARYLIGAPSRATLPNLLADQTGATPQTPKNIFGQYAVCDQTIPNATNLFLLDQIGLVPTPGASATKNVFRGYSIAGAPTAPACTATGVNPHGFLLQPTDPAATAAGQADAAAYLLSLTTPSTPAFP